MDHCPEGRENEIGHVIKKTDLCIKRSLHSCVKKRGIDEATAMHGFILGFLRNNSDRDIYQKDIEAHLDIGRSSVTTLLNLMEKRGYITRCSVERDARLKKISITEKGIAANDKIVSEIISLEDDLRCGITEDELKCCFAVLAKIRENAENHRTKTENSYK